jgi:hypothetical protein
MGRRKGTPKTGGRKAGTPNKATAAVKGYIQDVLDMYMAPAPTKAKTKADTLPTLVEDLRNMEPAERVRAMTQLAGYIIPKQQALSIDEQTAVEEEALLNFLETAPEDAINAIAAKVLEMQAKNSGRQGATPN